MATTSFSAIRIFPPNSVARQSVVGRLLRLEGVTAGRASRAILSLLPLDAFVEKPALRMEIIGRPQEIPPVQAEVQKEIDAAEGRAWPMGSIERFAFYELAKKVVLRGADRRAPFLRMLHLQERRHCARGVMNRPVRIAAD